MLCTSWIFLSFLNDEYLLLPSLGGKKCIKIFGRLEGQRSRLGTFCSWGKRLQKPKLDHDHYDRIQTKNSACCSVSNVPHFLQLYIQPYVHSFNSNHPSIHKTSSPLFPYFPLPFSQRALSNKNTKKRKKKRNIYAMHRKYWQ